MAFSVLIVGNNPEKNFYTDVLGKYGMNVFTSTSPDHVLENVDMSLIIYEHDRKKRDGFSFLKANREKIKDSLTVILTKNPDVKDAVAFMKEGVFDYLPGPLEKERLDSFARFLIEKSKKVEEKPKPQSDKKEHQETIGNSLKIMEVINLCRKVAKGKSTVLIQGETGTGKELVAKMIHHESPRANKPFVAVNCAAFPEGLLESELFGHQKGAFTGAIERKIGKMELANGGSILFDEISEMNVLLQAKLLRAIQEKEIDSVGGKKPIPIDVRIIATTNRNLKKHIEDGKFREDLYYRLNVIPIKLPSLRERKNDIPLLIDHFIEKHCHENGFEKKTISPEIVDLLSQQNWPGNIRELENVIERAVIISPSDKIEMGHIFLEEDSGVMEKEKTDDILLNEKKIPSSGVTMAEMEKKLILNTLKDVMNNRQRAAEVLGIHVRTLRNKLNEYKKEGMT